MCQFNHIEKPIPMLRLTHYPGGRMPQSASNKNEPSKMNQLLNGQVDQSIKARLPRSGVSAPPPKSSQSSAPDTGTENKKGLLKLRPAFWTIASVISLSVNMGLLIVLLVVYQMLGGINGITSLAQNQATGILGGLYHNFVKMDQAHIRTNIHVEKEIPVNFILNVSGPTNVTLSQDVVIEGALVTVETGGLNIVNARARIVLPANTVLPITIQNLVVPVDQKVLAVLDVPIDIPLNQTELHDPFVGLRMVVEPFYCFLKPDTIIDGVNVCSPVADIQNSPEPIVP
jgi:hypothetical protein